MKKHQNFINGHWCDPVSNQWSENINPSDRTTLGLFPRSNKKDIENAAAAAKKALKKWRLTPPPVRAEYLFKAAEYLEKNKNDYIGALRLIPKKILWLYIHSYQSYLWNIIAKKSKKHKKTFPLGKG